VVPFIWFPNKVCQLHELAPERAWVGPSNLSVSREPFSYTQNWLQVFSFSAWFPCIWFPLSKVLHMQESARERATNYSFQKSLYIQVPIVCFLCFWLSWCIIRMTAQPTIPWTPFQKQYMSFRNLPWLFVLFTSVSLCFHASSYTDCWLLELVFLINLLWNVQPLTFIFLLEYFFDLNVTRPPCRRPWKVVGYRVFDLSQVLFCVVVHSLTMILSTNFF